MSEHFIGQERVAFLYQMFSHKKSQNKLYIPIGLNMLKLNKVERKPTKKKGMYMYVVEMWKPPEQTSWKADKSSYKPLQCFHILTGRTDGDFKKNWYRPFTNNLREKDLVGLKDYVGKWFQALVKQVEDKANLKDKHNPKIIRNVDFVRPEIVAVYPKDREDIEFNYLDLYKPYDKF